MSSFKTSAPLPADLPPSGGGLFAAFQRGWDPASVFLQLPGGQRWTYADLERVSTGYAARLRRAGLRKGDRLVSLVGRSPWNLFLYLACMRAGVVFIPLNPAITAAELVPILADAEAALAVCAPSALETMQALPAGTQPPAVSLDGEGGGSFEALASGEADAPEEVDADDDAAILFTSGTTGRPKGVVMPHGHLVTKARAVTQALGYRSADRLLHAMPLHHAHGLFMTTNSVLCAGASMLLLPRFDAAEVVDALPSVSVFSGVPTMYRRMPGVSSLREKSRDMRLFISASAALPPEVFLQFEQQSGHRILECWGLTETLTNTANPLDGARRPGSVGLPLAGVEVRAVDGEGRLLPHGEPGAIEVRATSLFKGYWRRPAEQQPQLRDGFFPTGDIGFLDASGHLAIVGRSSETIVSGGFNVHPREVELALEQVDGVCRAAVFGLAHPDLGEAVAAAVELEPGRMVDRDDVLAQLKLRLTGYKIPKALFRLEQLPLTELGKLQRGALSARFADHFMVAGS